MNHHDRLTKAYRGLNADQSAALAFHYISEGNALEFKRLGDAVPRKDYNCPDVAYQARLDGFTRFAACWAIEHWRLRCHKAEMLGAALAATRRNDDEKADTLLDAHERAESCLLALDVALAAICAEHGLDAADVRRMAGTEAFEPMREGMTPDADYLDATRAGLSRLVGEAQ